MILNRIGTSERSNLINNLGFPGPGNYNLMSNKNSGPKAVIFKANLDKNILEKSNSPVL